MNILLIGSGGREHAIAKSISESPQLSNLYIAPGNAGTAGCGKNTDLDISDFDAVKRTVTDLQINMVIVGPEDPLVRGITDFFSNDDDLKNIPVIGPVAEGAKLEGSKDYAKSFMQRHGIPTASYHCFSKETLDEGYAFLDEMNAPYVLKADGLAAGKGVVICEDLEHAKSELKAMLVDSKFGKASENVVIESFLDGIELSVFVLSDGKNYKILPSAKDYKRIGENDTGLNTGGMGAVSPVPFADDTFMKKVEERIVIPTINGLQSDSIDYKGFIFIGLMNVDGDPMVIEYNVRMGDPETEVVFPRITSDVVALFKATAEGRLDEISVEIDPRTAVTVMLVSGGYPESYQKGMAITGLDEVQGSIVFHAGTRQDNDAVLTNGGRVIAVTSLSEDLDDALSQSFQNAEKISFKGKYYRTDIGLDLQNVTTG